MAASLLLAQTFSVRAFLPKAVGTAPRALASAKLFMSTATEVKPEETALLCIEFQNDFAHPDGKLYSAVKDEMARVNTVANAQKLVEDARAKGVKIMHAPIKFQDDYGDMPNTFGILAGIKDGGIFKASEWGSEFIEEMTPEIGDIVVEGKKGLDTYPGSNLQELLTQNGIKRIAICGFLTNCCVESTMRSSYEAGLEVVTIPEACCATSQEEHEAAEKYTFNMFSKPMTGESFVNSV